MSNKPKIADLTVLKWPSIDSNKEETVLNALENVFSKYKSCLRTIKKPPKWKKVEEEKQDKLSEEEEMQRKIFKSRFVVGIQTVMKKLERNGLSAVLLWRDMQPAVLRKALLQLISQHGCSAVCVSDLLSTLQQSWPGLTSAAALGILKMEEPNDFEELVASIRMHAPKVADFSVGEVKQPEQPDAVSEHTNQDNAVSEENREQSLTEAEHGKVKTQPKTVSLESSLSNEICNKNICRPKVDTRRYYIYKNENSKSKSFSGQSFISFDEGPPCTVVETVKGVRVQKGARKFENPASFGIRPSLKKVCDSDNSLVTDETKGGNERSCNNRKRKQLESETTMESGYKKINVKKLQNNIQKKKKTKKKKKKK